MKIRILTPYFLTLFLVFYTSCASLKHPEEERQAHYSAMHAALQESNARLLSQPLDLNQCIRIAMERNYDLRLSALQRRLSELSVAQSFSNFMPQLSISAQWTTWRHQQTMSGMPIADTTYRNFAYGGSMPIFMPSAWLLYANRHLAMEQSALSAHIARQSVECNVTALFYQCIICEDEVAALNSQVASTKSQYERISQMYKEEQVRNWELVQAETQYKSRQLSLAVKERELSLNRSKLLNAMGLSPMDASSLQLVRDEASDEQSLAVEPLPELVLQALATHPELSVADRQIVIAENDVRTAIANFLPVASGFLNGSWTSDTIADRATNLYGGFAASMDVFSGFAKYNTYRSAKIARRQAELNRNSLFLTIILEVISAHNQFLDSMDSYELAQLNYRAMAARYQDYLKRYDEGLEPAHEMLDARAKMDEAEELLVASRCQRNVARTMLEMAMGRIAPPEDAITEEEQEFAPKVKSGDVLLKPAVNN